MTPMVYLLLGALSAVLVMAERLGIGGEELAGEERLDLHVNGDLNMTWNDGRHPSWCWCMGTKTSVWSGTKDIHLCIARDGANYKVLQKNSKSEGACRHKQPRPTVEQRMNDQE